MKKALFLLVALAITIGLNSCKKSYSCDCSYVLQGGDTTTHSYAFNDISANSSSDAQSSCDAQLNTATQGNTVTFDCEVAAK